VFVERLIHNPIVVPRGFSLAIAGMKGRCHEDKALLTELKTAV
jgi:hypothetical protein